MALPQSHFRLRLLPASALALPSVGPWHNTTVIEMVEMVEIFYGRLGKRSVERVRYVLNNLLHLVIVKYGVISLVLCISTCLRLVTILSLLVKYLVIFHADQCNTDTNTRPITLPCSLERAGNEHQTRSHNPYSRGVKCIILHHQNV